VTPVAAGSRPPIAHKLLAAREAWKEIGGESLVLRGITAEWRDEDSPRRLERRRKVFGYTPMGERVQIFRNMLEEELREGIVVEIPEEEAKWFNATFLVPKKKKGQFRKILDCRELNEEIKDVHFKMEGPEAICEMIRAGDWATSIDIKSAFNHVPVDQSLRPYLAFRFGGKTYTYAGMPFGIKHAPRVFTLLMRKAMAAIRLRFNVRAVSYMDDILLLFDEAGEAFLRTREIGDYLERLGWTLAWDKCEMDPVQDIDFLGWRWHLEEARVTCTPGRRTELKEALKDWQGYAWDREPRPIRELAALLGRLNFVRLQVPEASLHTQRMDQTKADAVRRHGWDGSCTPNPSLMGELKWWNRTITENTPTPVHKYPIQATLTTDASPTGWGAVLSIGAQSVVGFGAWTDAQRAYTSNAKELQAVQSALLHFEQQLRPLKTPGILIQSDNAATVADINRCSASGTLTGRLLSLMTTVREMEVQLQVVHIPGLSNDGADRLSRIGQDREYYLKEHLYKHVTEQLGFQPEFDAFGATPYLPSEIPFARIFDALRPSWKGKRLLIHPPPTLLMKTISKATREEPEAILLIPNWTGQPWQPLLTQFEQKRISVGTFDWTMETTERFRQGGWRLPPGEVHAVLMGTKTTKESVSSGDC
jgi:ribonuclease HI